MKGRLQGITIGLLAGVMIASVHAGEQVGLDGLGPAEYSVAVSGAVSAEGSALPADDGDTGITDEQLRAREVSERALYTGDTFYKPASGADGPFELTFSLGPDYVTVDGMEQPSLSVRLHFAEGIAADSYDISDGFLDVGPNAAPVAVLVSATSADGKSGHAFGWKVDGTLTLEQIDREAATGHFRFGANKMDREGRVTDDRVTAEGAFRDIPFVPEDELPGA